MMEKKKGCGSSKKGQTYYGGSETEKGAVTRAE